MWSSLCHANQGACATTDGSLSYGEGGGYQSQCSARIDYTDGWSEGINPTECFGAQGRYRMKIDPNGGHSLFIGTNGDANSDMTFGIRGNLGCGNCGGCDASCTQTYGPFIRDSLTGFTTAECNGDGRTNNYHLLIASTSSSPNVGHEANNDNEGDREDDYLTGIGPGASFLYFLYTSPDGHGSCIRDPARHEAIFTAMADAISSADVVL